MTALIALLLTQSPTLDAEVFVDRGETYLRAGSNHGLQVGNGLEILDPKTRLPVGSGVVMEVWESLARLSLDSKAAAHPTLKVVRVSKPAADAQDFYVNPAPRPGPSAPPPPPAAPVAVGPRPPPAAAVVSSPAAPQAAPAAAGLIGYA